MPEAVDRLELVADEEELTVLARQQVDQLALEPVRVLELIDHDRAEAPALALANLLVLPQELARQELQVLEVEGRFPLPRRAVGALVGEQELLQLLAVPRSQPLEGRVLDRAPGLLELGASREVGEIEQRLRAPCGLEERDELVLARLHRCRAQLIDPLAKLRVRGRLQAERKARRAKRLVDPGEHPAQPPPAVRREQAQTLDVVAAELLERRTKGLAAQHTPLAVVEHAEARVDAGRERIRAQKPVAEAVDGRDPGRVEIARQVVAAELPQPLANPRPQLAGRALGVRDHEDRVDVEAALANRAAEALHDHRRLAGAGAGRDEDDPRFFDRPLLLDVRSLFDGAHDRFTRHIVQRSHQVGQGKPPFGSWRTSPSRIRLTTVRACSCARSIWPQKASSST